MKKTIFYPLLALGFSLFFSACTHIYNPPDSPVTNAPVINLLTPTATPTAMATVVTTFCVQNMLCIQGSHWDPSVCNCAPDSTGTPSPSPTVQATATTTFCVQNMLCIQGDHWDPSVCGCVPNSTASPSLTATPMPNLTPVCGMTPITIPGAFLSLADSGIHVIQNTAQWNNFIRSQELFFSLTPSPTPTPPPAPVNFASQMIITDGDPEPCDNTTTTITDVCVGPSQVTVHVAVDTCTTCPQCWVASNYSVITSAVAVSQSSLPVSVVYTYTTH